MNQLQFLDFGIRRLEKYFSCGFFISPTWQLKTINQKTNTVVKIRQFKANIMLIAYSLGIFNK